MNTPIKTDLDDVKILHGVPATTRRGIASSGTRRTLVPGEVLITQGQPSTAMYFLLRGELKVTLHEPTAEPIAIIAQGETVGELGVLDGSNASAFVVARSDSEVLALDEEAFWQLTHSSHAFSINLLVKLAERLRKNNATVGANIEKRRLYERAAMFDGLTGIHNRRWLDDTLHRLVERHDRDQTSFCLSLLDIDHFKRFNDDHGHDAGDAVLAAVATVMSQTLRPTDLVARFGGEEFVILFPETDLDDAMAAAERVREAIATAFVTMPDGSTLPRVTVSMGVARLRARQEPAALLKAADVAMYQGKKTGRNRVVAAP